MANYVDAINKVLAHEGGFVNDPLDRGGATNYGIIQAVYEKFIGKKVTTDEMKNMPKGNAIAIYKKEYWDKVGGDKIKYYSVAYALFDQAVNRGVSTVNKQVQKVLNLPQDGIMGSKTIEALNKVPEKDFLNQFLLMSKQSYESIVDRNPSQEKFLKGWLNRLSSIQEYTSKFLGTTTGKITVGLGGIFLVVGSFFLIRMLRKK